MAEQQQIAAAVNQVRSAAETFSTNKREEAELVLQQRQAELAIAKAQGDTAKEAQLKDQVDTAQEAVNDWSTGGKNRQAMDATLNGLGLALGGNSIEAVAAGAASPYVNTAIKHATEGEGYEWANLALHGIWGAVEAATQGANALGGASSAVTGEVAAKILTEKLFGETNPEALTEEQKRTVSQLSQMIAGTVSGGTELAQGGDAVSSVQNVNVGMGIAKNAVENNYLYADEAAELRRIEGRLTRKDLSQEEREFLERERARLKGLDEWRQTELAKSCQTGSKSSAECSEWLGDAAKADMSYQGSSRSETVLMGGSGSFQRNVTYEQDYQADYNRVQEALEGNDFNSVNMERIARQESERNGTTFEEELAKQQNLHQFYAWHRVVSDMTEILTSAGKTSRNGKSVNMVERAVTARQAANVERKIPTSSPQTTQPVSQSANVAQAKVTESQISVIANKPKGKSANVVEPVVIEKATNEVNDVVSTAKKTTPKEPVNYADDVNFGERNQALHQKISERGAAEKKAITACSGVACFVAGTLIETAEGLKKIEEIRHGDLIWSREEFGEEYAYKPVIETKATQNQAIFEVTVGDETGQTETYLTTEEHPFYVDGKGWVKASLLEADMALLDRDGNATLKVIKQHQLDKTDTVYNFEVENYHTYHIGALGVWVHNSKCCEVLESGKVAEASRSGNISGKKVNEYGLKLDASTPEEKRLVDLIKSGKDSKAGSYTVVDNKTGKRTEVKYKAGDLTETLMNKVLSRNELIPLSDTKYGGNKGFDGVYWHEGKNMLVIADGKPIKGSTALSTKGAGSNIQLSPSWIDNVITKLPDNSQAKRAILRARLSGDSIHTVIFGVNKKNGNVEFIPVKVKNKDKL